METDIGGKGNDTLLVETSIGGNGHRPEKYDSINTTVG
jgi:hypothetical protein